MKQAIATSGGRLRLCLLYGRDRFSCYTLELTEYERIVRCRDETDGVLVNGLCRYLKLTWGNYSALSFTPATAASGGIGTLALGRFWLEWRRTSRVALEESK